MSLDDVIHTARNQSVEALQAKQAFISTYWAYRSYKLQTVIGLMNVDVGHPDKEYWNSRYISEYTFREKNCHDLLDETIESL